ncbi:MAG: oligosaccharide flippase family protein [Caldilineaceae bacterium]
MAPNVQQAIVRGIGHRAVASLVTTLVGFTRSVILAQLLLPNDFGTITFTLFFTNLIGSITQFSLRHAFIHHETQNEDVTAATLFFVDIGMALGRVGLAFLLYPLMGWLYPDYPLLPTLLIVFFAASVLGAATGTPIAILERRLDYRYLARLDMVISIFVTVITIGMAWTGWGIWSLVAEFVLTRLILAGVLFIFKPPWRLRWVIDWGFIREFRRFSLAISGTNLLGFLLDRFDDFWIGSALGATSLGFYSKAYEYAQYPRRVLADPTVNVTFPAFARLQHETQELAQVFARATGLLIRSGCLVSVTLFVVAPEFIEFLLGPKWLPSVLVFRLMVIYAIFDPLFSLLSMFLIAIGRPATTTKTRLFQVLVFIPAVILMGKWFDINGVALAADAMIIVGFGQLLYHARQSISFSVTKIALAPLAATVVSGALVWLLTAQPWLPESIGLRLLIKSSLTIGIYLGLLLLVEFRTYLLYAEYAKQVITKRS